MASVMEEVAFQLEDWSWQEWYRQPRQAAVVGEGTCPPKGCFISPCGMNEGMNTQTVGEQL